MLSNTSVLLADDRHRTALYESWLPECLSVRTVHSTTDVYSQIDDSVRAAFIRHEIPEEDKNEIESLLAATSTDCRIAVTTSKQHEILYPDIVCDISIYEPITEQKIRDGVERLLRRSLYVDGVRRHYELSVQLASDELYPEEGDEDEAVDEIQAKMDRTDEFLDEMRRLLDEADHDAIIATLQQRNDDLQQSTEPPLRQEKYRPDRCSECKLNWNEYHDTTLGQGFEALGAYTWRCNQCHSVVSVPDPTDRTVARR